MCPDAPATGKPIPEYCDGLARLQAVVHDLRSPGGCPWDREQTHESLTTNMLEEAYEAVEALRSGDVDHMREELGDVLLQVVLHAEIASERRAFDLQDVAHAITEKLIRRHPHVYGQSSATTTEAVLTQWDAIKRQEKGEAPRPFLHGVGSGLPALARAAKLSNKASKIGFDWPDAAGVLDKIREELAEIEAEPPGSIQRAEEIGDLLFAVANLARKEGFDPEVLCTAANDKFATRFSAMESELAARGHTLGEVGLEEMERLWTLAKNRIPSSLLD
ncbi:MAG: nucleoside triphosphate pyrophosphohydrolase [Verrucomicrobiales bacterium]